MYILRFNKFQLISKDNKIKYRERRLLQAQKEAKSKNRGLWDGSTKKIMEGME